MPTYVITHGWQREEGRYNQPGFNFSEKNLPGVQQYIPAAIETRFKDESKNFTTPVEANIITFEWEGAYTGGKGADDQWSTVAARAC